MTENERTIDLSGPRDIDKCPVCTSVQVRKVDDREVFGTSIRQAMSCANCDSKWIDNFRYVSYTIAK